MGEEERGSHKESMNCSNANEQTFSCQLALKLRLISPRGARAAASFLQSEPFMIHENHVFKPI